ncbi:MAG: hypothetical protein IH987_07420 [Planctomycetes bacterium]|nr:hypothetical protein [Planctomycetota bacterium]
MRLRKLVTLVIAACFCITISTGWLASAGDLDPPPGPINSTMITLDDIAALQANIAASISGLGVKRVYRGVAFFSTNIAVTTATIPFVIDPSKAVVYATNAVSYPGPGEAKHGWAVIVDQVSTTPGIMSITFRRAINNQVNNGLKLSYQVVEYN